MRVVYLGLALLMSCLAVEAAESVANESALRPTSLWNWLRIIDLDGFQLLTAIDQSGCYFAVKQDADGDLLFCVRERSKTVGTSFILEITDEQGRLATVFPTTKKSPKSVLVEYKNPVYAINYPAGTICELNSRDLKRVRVQYWEVKDEARKILFDQMVELRKTP